MAAQARFPGSETRSTVGGRQVSCLWADPAEMAVPAGVIVKHFDVIEDIGPGHITGLVAPFLNALLFQAAEEGFGNGVVLTVTAPTHAGLQIIVFAKTQPVVAAVLCLLVGMHQHRVLRTPAPHNHQSGFISLAMANRVEKWRQQLGLGEYAAVFAEQKIDEDVFPELTDESLEKPGMPLAHRKKLLRAIGESQPGLATFPLSLLRSLSFMSPFAAWSPAPRPD